MLPEGESAERRVIVTIVCFVEWQGQEYEDE